MENPSNNMNTNDKLSHPNNMVSRGINEMSILNSTTKIVKTHNNEAILNDVYVGSHFKFIDVSTWICIGYYLEKIEILHLGNVSKYFHSTYGIYNNHFEKFFRYDQIYWKNHFSLLEYNEMHCENNIVKYNLNEYTEIKEIGVINICDYFDRLRKNELIMLKYYIIFYEQIVEQSFQFFGKECHIESELLSMLGSISDPTKFGIYIPTDFDGILITKTFSKYIGKWIASIFKHIKSTSPIKSFRFIDTSLLDEDIQHIANIILQRRPPIKIDVMEFRYNQYLTCRAYYSLKWLIQLKIHHIQSIIFGNDNTQEYYTLKSDTDKRTVTIENNKSYTPWFNDELCVNAVIYHLSSQYIPPIITQIIFKFISSMNATLCGTYDLKFEYKHHALKHLNVSYMIPFNKYVSGYAKDIMLFDCDTLYNDGTIHSPGNAISVLREYGGIIIIHCYKLMNNLCGLIKCSGIKQGGFILIVCEKFINKGKIDASGCIKNGKIAVYTNAIISKGYINPEPYIGNYMDGLYIINVIKSKCFNTQWVQSWRKPSNP